MRLRDRLWNPYVLVFLSSACIMVIELVASRLIAPRVGVSLHTWTAVIGVILAGISLGNYIGGRLADRWASPTLLGIVLYLAALSTLAILWLNNDLHDFRLPGNAPLMLWVVLYIAAVFLLPSVVLGCVSPIIVKLSLTNLQRTGRTVGQIYAWSTVGSIVGTFATGFWLIAAVGTKSTILGVAGLLMILALWFLTDTRWWWALLRAIVALALFGAGIYFLHSHKYLLSECLEETNYFCINVHQIEKDGRPVRELVLDRLVHSYTDLEDPTHLVYGYEKTYVGLIAPLAERKPDLSAFFIGGGGYTYPRYMEATLPESHLVVAEIDPGVTEVAHDYLGLARDTRIASYGMDARNYLALHAEPDSFDIIFGDAFNDFSVPFHLTTLEFDQLVDRALRPGGLYLVNIIDAGPQGHFFRAYVNAFRRVFRNMAVIPSLHDWQENLRTTYVIVGSQEPLDLSQVPIEYPPLTDQALADYMAMEPPLVLTDDYVPVDNLMAPVVEASFAADQLDDEIMARINQRVVVVVIGGALLLVGGCVWLALRLRARRRRAAA